MDMQEGWKELRGRLATSPRLTVSKCRSCCACPGSRPRRPGSATNHPARWPCARCPSRFDAYGFAVTVGLDGPADVHDRLRPSKGGRGSFERIIERVRPLLKLRGRMQTSARVTVTPDNLDLSRTLDEFLALGFHSVGFSPMLTSPTGRGRNGPLRAPGDAGGDDRVWREIRTKDYDRVAICLLERSDRLARTPPWQPSPRIHVVREAAISGIGRWRACGLPPVCWRRGRRHGLARRGHRPRAKDGLAARSPRASTVTMRRLLGALPLRWRLLP